MSRDSTAPIVKQFDILWNSRHELAKQVQAEGKKIFGCIYSHVPEELIHAAGIIPIQIVESNEDTDYAKGSQEIDIYHCDFVRSCLGQGLNGTYQYLDGVVFAHSCETMRILGSLWELLVQTPFFFWYTPLIKKTEAARQFYREQLRELKSRLEEFCGHGISDEALRVSIEIYNENKSLINRLYRLKQVGLPLDAHDYCVIVRAGLVISKEHHNRLLRKLLEVDFSPYEEPSTKPRIMLSYFNFEHCMSDKLSIGKILEEELGARIVADDLASGRRYFSRPIDIQGDPMEALVEGYLGSVPISFKQTLEDEITRISSEAVQSKAKGVIILFPKYCTDFMYQLPSIESKLRRLGMRTLVIETTEQMPIGQLRTRLGAFVEALTK